jgi:hypothetical protein
VSATVTPGAVKAGEVVEVTFDVAERLKVASARFGSTEPLAGVRAVAEVSPPPTGKNDEPVRRYRVHALQQPGAYGFHFTPASDGEYTVKVTGTTKAKTPFALTIPVHAGVWPPPDFDTEELNNKTAALADRDSGRKIAGGGEDE